MLSGILLGAAPAGASGQNQTVFSRPCGQNLAVNQNWPGPAQSRSVTVVASGNCSGTVGSQMKRADGSLTGIVWGNGVIGWWGGAIWGSYHYGCSGCSGSWPGAV